MIRENDHAEEGSHVITPDGRGVIVTLYEQDCAVRLDDAAMHGEGRPEAYRYKYEALTLT